MGKKIEQIAQEWYEYLEAQRAKAIENAKQAGTIIQVERATEPFQRYQLIARQLSKEPDGLRAIAILDDMVKRECGQYIFFADGRIGQNTTDTQTLKDIISMEVAKYTSDKADKALIEYYLNRWKQQQPTATNELPLPLELDTERARKGIKRAIEQGFIEVVPEGLKWLGISKTGRRGAKSQLGFFCLCAWCPKNVERLPETAVCKLFGVIRIGSSITKLLEPKKPQAWREPILALFIE